jgi:hypothetical protein
MFVTSLFRLRRDHCQCVSTIRQTEEQHRNLSSQPEQIELLRCATARFSGHATQSFQQALNAMVNGCDGVATATREFCARETFEFELGEKSPFLLGQPSPALAVIKKFGK